MLYGRLNRELFHMLGTCSLIDFSPHDAMCNRVTLAFHKTVIIFFSYVRFYFLLQGSQFLIEIIWYCLTSGGNAQVCVERHLKGACALWERQREREDTCKWISPEECNYTNGVGSHMTLLFESLVIMLEEQDQCCSCWISSLWNGAFSFCNDSLSRARILSSSSSSSSTFPSVCSWDLYFHCLTLSVLWNSYFLFRQLISSVL